MKTLRTFLSMAFLCLLGSQALQSQQLAFPGAEGFGRYTTGGRGGTVYHVTNLNDDGPGSFRDAVSQSNRTVVFDVGGVINISSRIVIHSNVTVAGQTAPGDGITIYGNGIAFNDDSGNNIIRYIRIRMGKNGDSGKDAVAISAGQDYIFDHVSISWGRDGTLDVNGSGIDNLTFQDCIISQGINNTNHSTGGLMQSGKWSMIRSLYIDNKTRNPKARGQHEFINSVLYNWDEHGYIMGDTEGLSECNLIGNYFIYGPSSNSNSHITGTTPSFHVYAEDNWLDDDTDGNLDGFLLTDYKTATVESSPYSYPGVINQLSAQDALNHVIQNAGASLSRDAVDELLINQLTSYGTAGQIINTEDDNGIPGNVGTVNGGTPPTDSDGDGMSDAWESQNGTNPNTADNNGDIDGDGYTNLEEYLDWIVNGDASNPAELIKHGSGSSSQAVTLGESINDFYYSWTNANGVNVTGLPSGVNASVNTSNQTVTISGTPTEIGTFDYTITTTGGLPNASTGGTFTITSGSGSATIQENATGFCGVDGTVDSDNDGYSGSGFANTDNSTGNGVDWKVDFTASNNKTFTFRYASSNDRPANLIVNGNTLASNISFPSTGGWTSWSTVSVTVYTNAGISDVRLEASGSDGLGNIDYVSITDANAIDCSISTQTYSLSTSVTGQGSVNPSSGTYNEGEVVTLTSSPASGWQFDNWSGDAGGSSSSVNITMDSDKNVTANFSEIPSNQYSLSTNVNGQGSISLNPSGGTYDEGTSVTITANPASGWQFDGWSGALGGSTNPASVIMNSNLSVTANFSEIPTSSEEIVLYTFDQSSGTSIIDASGNGNTATANGGAGFTSGQLNNAIELDGSDDYVSMPTGILSSLNDFTIATWVNIDAVETWSRIFDFGTGTSVNMFLTPQSGSGNVRYAITTGGSGGEQQINGTSPLPSNTWTHVAVTLSGNTGTLYVNGSAVGSNSNMTLSPADLGNTGNNYIGQSQYPDPFLDGQVDQFHIYNYALSSSELSSLYDQENSTQATTYTLTTSVNGQGTVSPSGGTYDEGTVVNLTASPASGWQFDSWSGGLSGSSNPASVTMNSNISVTANFSQVSSGSITIQENETGFCSVNGSVDSDNGGYTGSGFANTDNNNGEGISWSINVPSTGSYTLDWRFANGSSTHRTAQLLVDGNTVVSNIDFTSTGSWTTWSEVTGTSVNLGAGDRIIRLQATNSSGLANIDYIEITGAGPSPVSCAGLQSATIASNQSHDSELTVYTTGSNNNTLVVNYYLNDVANVQLSIYDVHGKQLLIQDLGNMEKGMLNESIEMNNWKPGIYLIKASFNGEMQSAKFMKQ